MSLKVRGWRALGLGWGVVLVLVTATAVTLQILGPPPQQAHASLPPAPAAEHARSQTAPTSAQTEHATAKPVPEAARPEIAHAEAPAHPPGGLAAPDPALLEPAPDITNAQLPRIAADGRMAMQVYARPVNPADKRPRVAMLVVGFGLSAADSKAALEALPPAVTLGISPYTHDRTDLPTQIREHGHEYLLTLPMESQGYPLNDSGPRALLTGAEAADNDRNFEWVLSRIQGEVGLTGASDGLRGERYAAATSRWTQLRDDLAARGLLYVDPRPNAPVTGAAIAVTTVVDDPPDRAAIEAKLTQLEQQARENGVAIGLAGPLRPMTTDRIAAWARGLDGRGINLVPVSALVPRSEAGHTPEPQPARAHE